MIAVEPYPGHKIQGLKNMKESYRPGIFDKTLPHAIVNVADEDAFSAARRLAAEEGVFAGMSSGAALFAAIERARELDRGCIVAILPDGGERYLSTTLFKPQQQAEPEVSQLKLFNTMSRRKEVFRPLHPDRVTLYACGPTAFTSPNLAHCRRFIVADLIGRALRFCGYTVASYMNFTDLDDNTIAGAIAANEDLRDFTGRYIAEFKQAAETLGVEPAAGHPLASEHVADIAHPTALIYLPAPPWGDAKAAMHDMLVRAVASALDDLDEREPWITGTDIGYTGGGYQRATIVEVAVDDAARLDDAVAAVLRAGRAIFAEDDDDARQRWLSVMRGAQQTDAVTASDRFAGKADLVASYLTYTTDLRFWFAHMHATDAVTVPELRRYAAELFDRRAVHVATVRPSGREGVGGGAARVAISDHEYDLPPWRASVDPDGADRPEPVPPPPPPLRLYQDRLANGLHLIMYVAPRSPTFEARLVFPRGRIDEAPTERGVATLAATLLDHNHERRYAMPIYETLVWALTTVGTQVRVAVDEETTTFATRGLTMFGDWHLWRLAWLLDQGVYADSALARFRDMLRAHQERAASPSGRAFAERLYGVGHPYATPAASNAELARVGRRELNRWRRQTFVPDGATLIISGGFDPDEMLDNVRALFDGFPRRSVPARAPVAAPRPAAGPSWIGTRIPTDTQVTLYVSVTAASDRDRDRWARQILAEMVRDRLRVVRESMGASYGVQSSYHVGAAGSTFDITAALDPDRAPRAATAVRAALTALRDDPATMAADFVRARRRLVSQALATSTDPGDVADRIAWAVEHGGDLTQLNRVASDLAEVTLDQVAAVARADLDPARMVISVDGRAAPVQATLDALAATDVAWFDE